MKLNKNKGNLQNQLAKMLQAGMENVEQETPQQAPQDAPQQGEQDEQGLRANVQTNEEELHANAQEGNSQSIEEQEIKPNEATVKRTTTKKASRSIGSFQRPQTARKNSRASKSASSKRNDENEERGLNAAQRHEVPDRNAKYAGEPIKSVGCRMPVSLYARMLQYKALNDSQLNRITLNDIIIEAVEKFMDESK